MWPPVPEPAHVFDQTIRLRSLAPDVFGGHTGRAYWNMIGPFGGMSAATALNAVLQHPLLQGEPVSLTVNFASALNDGAFTITARAARTNRSCCDGIRQCLFGHPHRNHPGRAAHWIR